MKISELMCLDLERVRIKAMLKAMDSENPEITVGVMSEQSSFEDEDGDDEDCNLEIEGPAVVIVDRSVRSTLMIVVKKYFNNRLDYIEAVLKDHNIVQENKSPLKLVKSDD